MTVVKDPGRELFKMYVPDIKAFFEVSPACSLGSRSEADTLSAAQSHAEKPGDTMICTGKLVRNKPMYRCAPTASTIPLPAR